MISMGKDDKEGFLGEREDSACENVGLRKYQD